MAELLSKDAKAGRERIYGVDMGNGYYRVELRIPLKDVDQYKIVWYGNYLFYFDVARTELLRRFGLPPSKWDSIGFYAPVVNASATYHSPARSDDEIFVEVRPKVHRIAQITFLFRIL
jgi:acyl-CoA thioester hydrolase